jgi:hypothetical protein
LGGRGLGFWTSAGHRASACDVPVPGVGLVAYRWTPLSERLFFLEQRGCDDFFSPSIPVLDDV